MVGWGVVLSQLFPFSGPLDSKALHYPMLGLEGFFEIYSVSIMQCYRLTSLETESRPLAPCDSVRWIVVDWTLHTNVLAVDWDEKGNELNNATPTPVPTCVCD
jgi:hypothetical protein